MGFDSIAADLSEDSLLALATEVHRLWGGFVSYQPMRMELSSDGIYQAAPWTFHSSFRNDGEFFEIWLHWDGRARIEHVADGDRTVILRMGQGAAEIFKDMDDRTKGG